MQFSHFSNPSGLFTRKKLKQAIPLQRFQPLTLHVSFLIFNIFKLPHGIRALVGNSLHIHYPKIATAMSYVPCVKEGNTLCTERPVTFGIGGRTAGTYFVLPLPGNYKLK